MNQKLMAIALLFSAGGFGSANGQTLTNLYQFGGFATDGIQPRATLIQGTDGKFYGTTYAGGSNFLGTVFQITSQGVLSNLWSFNGTNGAHSSASLVQGSDGNFYGTTVDGGTNGYPPGYGTVFMITPQGALTNLWSFDGTNGANPTAGVVQGSDGNFYGTLTTGLTTATTNGGVFRITPQGALTNLWEFSGTDGSHPFDSLIQGSDGNFYGTTEFGGTNGYGTVFRISPQGAFTNLWQFNGTNGVGPFAALVQGNDGNFYGSTAAGGTNITNGTIFKITPQGALTTLWQFNGASGSDPGDALLQGSDGNFYGTTTAGITRTNSTVFVITPQGALTTLWQFNGTNSANTGPGLVQSFDGSFYGVTLNGGTNAHGTVFRLTVPLNPPANEISSIQIDPTRTNLVVSIPSVARETYQLQFTPALNPMDWTNVPNVPAISSPGGLLTLTNFGGASGPNGFFRFAITP